MIIPTFPFYGTYVDVIFMYVSPCFKWCVFSAVSEADFSTSRISRVFIIRVEVLGGVEFSVILSCSAQNTCDFFLNLCVEVTGNSNRSQITTHKY